MASNSETGFAKNAANLATMITIFTDMGATYNPSNLKSAIANLQLIYSAATDAQTDVNNLAAPDTAARGERDAIFDPVSKELTALRKAYKATEGVTKDKLDDFDSIVRKYRGASKGKKVNPDPTIDSQSNVHTSFDQRTNTIGELVALLTNTPNYNPNEPKFKVTYWQDVKDNMLLATKNVNHTSAPLALARTQRDDIFQDAPDNLVDTSNTARAYGLSIVPTGSTIYKALMRLKFKKSPN